MRRAAGPPEIFDKAAAAIEQGGVEAWAELPLEQLKPEGAVCATCSGTEFQKETDILDVWIDSGVSAEVVCETHSQPAPGVRLRQVHLPGRLRPAPGLVPLLPAVQPGRHRATSRTTPWSPTASCWTARARRCPRAWATSSPPRRSSRPAAPTSCAGGPPAWTTTTTCASPGRSWSAPPTPTARSATPCASSWAPWPTSTRPGTRCPRASGRPWTRGCGAPSSAWPGR